jgi:hypothetical protein
MRGLRVSVTTILGFVFGIICWLLASSGTGGIPASIVWPTAWSIILNRALLGFVIGISAWKINYMLHGIILGFIVSIPMAVSSLGLMFFTARLSGFKLFLGILIILIMGIIYGFLIELITHFIELITHFVVKEKKVEPVTPTS